MTEELARQALVFWGLQDSDLQLAAHRENMVFRVGHRKGDFALRLRRSGYRSLSELQSELVWMAALGEGGLTVPRPVPTLDGAYVVQVAGRSVDLLHWHCGVAMGRSAIGIDVPDAARITYRLGQAMAQLHALSDAWQTPAGFTRPRWDREGLLGEEPLWGRFWQSPALSTTERRLLERAREFASGRLDALAGQLDRGLIHADLLFENVLVENGNLCLIDFDDGGFGYRLFDLATTVLRLQPMAEGRKLQAQLIAGYHSKRALEIAELPLFLLLRACSYVGWIATRADVPGAQMRQQRAIASAVQQAELVLAG